jgi:hypothetical protein
MSGHRDSMVIFALHFSTDEVAGNATWGKEVLRLGV